MSFPTFVSRAFPKVIGFAVLAIVIAACDPSTNPNITPVVDLTVAVVDDAFQPVAGARVYLFPFRSPYDEYLVENPDGDESITPGLSTENVGVTNANGEATFPSRALEGSSYASGDTYIHSPNPIYVRVQASVSGNNLTNDQGLFKISFDDTESGEQIAEFVEIQVQ